MTTTPQRIRLSCAGVSGPASACEQNRSGEKTEIIEIDEK